ncbi:MAG TPA: hypothetical protein VFT49_02755 [Candidatus Saccharimonadales bacterium]|nr:hypothetical protein [Candidatus Saccharimonadales bacterium]
MPTVCHSGLTGGDLLDYANAMASDKNSGSLPVRGVIALAVLLAIAVGVAAYFQFRPTKTPISQKTSQNTKKPTTPTVSKQQAASNSEMTLSELGVKFKLSSKLNGLTYTVTTAPSSQGDLITIQLYLKSYSDLANQCAGTTSGTNHAFANLSKVTGSAASQPDSSIVARVNGSVIVNSGSSVPPTVACKDAQTRSQLDALGNQLTTELKQSFASASPI